MRALALLAAVAAVTAAATAPLQAAAKAPARAATTAPTPRRIAAAVKHAKSSAALWATISSCRSTRTGSEVDVRAQMPSLGFPATLSMSIQLAFYSSPDKRFVALTGANALKQKTLGQFSTNLHQWGAGFVFASSASGLWNATVQFTWTRGRQVLARVTRVTTAGHHDADYALPPHYSAAQCRLG